MSPSYNHEKNGWHVGAPNVIYYSYPHACHCNQNGALHCSKRKKERKKEKKKKENRGSHFSHNPSQPLSTNVGGSGKASDNMTWINIAFGREGSFSPKSGKVCQPFFHD